MITRIWCFHWAERNRNVGPTWHTKPQGSSAEFQWFWIKNVFLWSKMMKIFPKPRNLQLISIYVWIGTLIRGRGFVLDFRLNFWINPKSTRSHSGVFTLSSESLQNLPKINPIAFWSFDFSFRINPIAFWSFDFILRINPFAFWSIKKSKSTQNQLETHPKSQNQLKSSFWSTKKSKNNPKSTRNQPKINPNFELQSRTGANHLFERSTQKSTQNHLHLVWYPVRDDSRP